MLEFDSCAKAPNEQELLQFNPGFKPIIGPMLFDMWKAFEILCNYV